MVVSGYCRMQLPPINGVAQHTNGNPAQDEPVAPVAEGWNNVRKCATLTVADSAPRPLLLPPTAQMPVFVNLYRSRGCWRRGNQCGSWAPLKGSSCLVDDLMMTGRPMSSQRERAMKFCQSH
jgi:hypothetical protein